ncbi:prolyl 4-hydroxylase subunit alpha-1-like isoform X2 [Convolutriloba macropyga]|uniref:prolyl 4-hydroxylase subunit alpha-1-like isoform X2 n=1 Tax=Convolutriloba macropyga TaxID=536237 RepID=UPI003F52509B
MIIVLWSRYQCSTNVASAMGRLRDIFQADRSLENKLDIVVHQLQSIQQKIAQIKGNNEIINLVNILNETDDSYFDHEENLKHPTDQVLIIKRFHDKWKSISSRIGLKMINETIGNLMAELKSHEFLVEEAMSGLLRLQDTYGFPSDNLTKGVIREYNSNLQFTARDIYDLGRHAYNQEDYILCSEYMGIAMNLFEEKLATAEQAIEETVCPSCTEPNKDSIQHFVEILGAGYDYYHYCEYKLGNYESAVKLANRSLQLKASERLQINVDIIMGYIEDKTQIKKVIKFKPREADLCNQGISNKADSNNGEARMMEKHFRSWGKCDYNRNFNPVLILQPIKREIYSENPRVEFWHEFISSSEAEELKEQGLPELSRSEVESSPNEQDWAEYRVSQSSWLSHDIPLVRSIGDRITQATNLTMKYSEELQIANYGVGGQYEAHYDYTDPDNLDDHALEAGNRVATVLMYLSDVELGGTTAFPKLGLNVKPEKGGAVFWYNIKRDGHVIKDTLHAACPVIVGIKWVANQWIRMHGQEFVYQCIA